MGVRSDLEQDTLKEKGMKDMYYVREDVSVYLPEFARDVVLYGKTDSGGLLRAWDITTDDLANIVKMPLFTAALSNYKKMLAESETAVIQMHATDALEAALLTMKSRITAGTVSDANLVQMTKILTELSGARIVKSSGVGDIIGPVNTGTVIKVAYADMNAIPTPARDQAVNATFERIKDNYNFDGLTVDNYEHSGDED